MAVVHREFYSEINAKWPRSRAYRGGFVKVVFFQGAYIAMSERMAAVDIIGLQVVILGLAVCVCKF